MSTSTFSSPVYHHKIQNRDKYLNKMKGDCDDYLSREISRTRRKDIAHRHTNTFLRHSGKPDEIGIYKRRLEELEAAFYYNLEVISERDLELSLLEEQLGHGKERCRKLTQERDELEEIIKAVEEKYCRKIKHFEERIRIKDEEIKRLRRENTKNMNKLKGIIENVKQQEQNKLHKLATKFEIQKSELVRKYREESDEKEKYYLLEMDSMAGKLEEAFREMKELSRYKEGNLNLKRRLEDMGRMFKEMETYYQEEIKKLSRCSRKVETGTQCKIKTQVADKKTQTTPQTHSAESQTTQKPSEPEDEEEDFKKRITFLEEQNEVLKWVIKDLKKNRDVKPKTDDHDKASQISEGGRKCGECAAVKTEMEAVTEKFGMEIDNLKKILNDERQQRAEEEAVIQSLESSVTCLKDKLLTGLQQKLEEFAGDDICKYTYNREIHNEIQVSLLEEKLSKKIDALVMTTEKDRQKLNDKLEEFKKECLDRIEAYVKPRDEFSEMKGENLLKKIRLEIQKLENKIESDMKNMVRNNAERDKCDKHFQTKSELSESKQTGRKALSLPRTQFFLNGFETPRTCYVNDIFPEKCVSVLTIGREANKFQTPVRRRKVG